MAQPRGAHRGLTINPVAARHHLSDHTQAWLAQEARITEAHASQILSADKGVTRPVAERIASALNVPLGVLFPETVNFTAAVRYFTTSGETEVTE